MRIVRKLSRKRFQGVLLYEYERFFIPVPAKARDIVRPWVGCNVRIQVEPFAKGFAMLVYPEDRRIGMYMMLNRFKFLLKQLEKG